MLEDIPYHRFSEFATLSESEVSQIRALGEPPVKLPRHAVIRREGEKPAFVYLLIDGWVGSSMLLAAGERQIVKLHLPGDLVGGASLCLAASADTLFTLSPVTISRVPVVRFGALFMDSPRFAARIFLGAQRTGIGLMDRLALMGRSPAIARAAAMLLDLHERLNLIGQVTDDEFDLRMTQEEIGDFLGLTAVHVNRVFQQLQAEGLIRRRRQRVAILDLSGLRQRSGQSRRTIASDFDWLLEGPK